MRCLALADALRASGANCTFVCRTHTGHLLNLIRQRGHTGIALSSGTHLPLTTQDTSPSHASWLGTDWASDAEATQYALNETMPDWLIVDHYALDANWEKTMRPHCGRLMVIDDLADRPHDCNLLLDQNLGRTAQDYSHRIPHTATMLIGPQYALLRPEFATLRTESLARRKHPKLQHLLITLGGTDPDNVTEQVLHALCNCTLPRELHITVVMGAHAPWLEQVQTTANTMPRPTRVLVNVTHMAELMTSSDLCIGAAGGTAWERCCLGLPSLILALADNQQAGALALHMNGAALLFRTKEDLEVLMQNPLLSGENPTLLDQLSFAAAGVTSGNGLSCVIQELEHLHA